MSDRDENQRPAVQVEQLTQDCPKCHTGNLWANVQYKHKTVKACCEQCDFEGRVENPNFNFDKKYAEALRLAKEKMTNEFREVLERIFFNDDVIKTNSAMFLLRNSEAHEPSTFKALFPVFKENVYLLNKVVECYETGETSDSSEFEAPVILKLYLGGTSENFITRSGFPSKEAAGTFIAEWERLGNSVAWVKC